MFKVIEAFSGIGSQAKALKNINCDFKIEHTVEWDINAILAYYCIHNKKQSQNVQITSEKEVNDYFCSNTFSLDGKKAVTESQLRKIPKEIKNAIYLASISSNNLVSITDVKGESISNDIDLFTYSFPCQDLSMCGYWHGNKSGISRDAHNRSGMLWEVERILLEMNELDKILPKFLLMENVCNILSKTHESDFNDWKNTLVKLGYYNKIYCLNAKNFGIPQKRKRAYMLSIFTNNNPILESRLDIYFKENNLEQYVEKDPKRKKTLTDILCLDYSKESIYSEAKACVPNDTPSRRKIFEENDHLIHNGFINNTIVNTVTTKQDRNPNSGVIDFSSDDAKKSQWRYLTPRECFKLMGFTDDDFDSLLNVNLMKRKNSVFFSRDVLYKLAGNSIVVNVLEAIFKQVLDIKQNVLSNS